MYKRSILDYFRVHEPTRAKKNRNKKPEDVDSSDAERADTSSVISLSSTNSELEQQDLIFDNISDSDCNSDVVTNSLSVRDESDGVRFDGCCESNAT